MYRSKGLIYSLGTPSRNARVHRRRNRRDNDEHNPAPIRATRR